MFVVAQTRRVAIPAARNMATLKEISMRLKSVSNIAKITKSMKMIASTKMTKATRLMESARVYGKTSSALLQDVTVEAPKKPIVMAISSDRGLCGGIHSSVSKGVKKYVRKNTASNIITVGQKSKVQISREFKDNIVASFESVAKALPTWGEAAMIADGVLQSGVEFDGVNIFYNHFKSVIAYELTIIQVANREALENSPSLAVFEMDDDILANFAEFSFANQLYWTIAEGQASELSARRTAMENATKNAGEMIQKLTLTYNRQRQAVITNELCDIITGASAL